MQINDLVICMIFTYTCTYLIPDADPVVLSRFGDIETLPFYTVRQFVRYGVLVILSLRILLILLTLDYGVSYLYGAAPKLPVESYINVLPQPFLGVAMAGFLVAFLYGLRLMMLVLEGGVPAIRNKRWSDL